MLMIKFTRQTGTRIFSTGLLFVCLACAGGSGTGPLNSRFRGTPVYQLQKAFHEIYSHYRDSVVFISTEKIRRVRGPAGLPGFGDATPDEQPPARTRKFTGLGTGFILSKDGYICTNHHVIANVDRIRVKVGTREYPARVIGSDKRTDVALLKIEGNNFKPVEMGNSEKVRVGDWAIAIGNPFGLDGTFTVGVISAAVRRDKSGLSHIQTDASINPGNSGGPLINIRGEVIGVNRMIYSKSGGSMGIGFAIPINRAKRILGQLRRNGKVRRRYLGIRMAPLTPQRIRDLRLGDRRGALMARVYPDSPAARGGLRAGDVILALGGKPVRNFRDLINLVREAPIGRPVDVRIWRAGSEQTLRVVIQEWRR